MNEPFAVTTGYYGGYATIEPLNRADVVPMNVALYLLSDSNIDEFAALIHYPQCWDTVNYPTPESAIIEALSCAKCSVCNNVEA